MVDDKLFPWRLSLHVMGFFRPYRSLLRVNLENLRSWTWRICRVGKACTKCISSSVTLVSNRRQVSVHTECLMMEKGVKGWQTSIPKNCRECFWLLKSGAFQINPNALWRSHASFVSYIALEGQQHAFSEQSSRPPPPGFVKAIV